MAVTIIAGILTVLLVGSGVGLFVYLVEIGRRKPVSERVPIFIRAGLILGFLILLGYLTTYTETNDTVVLVLSAIYVVFVLPYGLNYFLKLQKEREGEEEKVEPPPNVSVLYEIKDNDFRKAAIEVAQRQPMLIQQLLLDGRTYTPPKAPDFLSQPDLSSIDTLIQKYGEPFKRLKDGLVKPLAMSEESRFEHTWILGPSGMGKTQLMQFIMSKDFETDASVMVIDSQGEMIPKIAGLKHIQDRVILVEPGEIALNPFDLKGEQAIDLLTFVFGAMGGELTARQTTLYRYCIRLLQEIPEATLSTFMHMLRPGGLKPYTKYVATLAEPAQLFFNDEFESKDFKEVKEQVSWRLKLLLESPVFERMFNAPRTKLNLSEALGSGKIVLVDTNKDALGDERSALFGRFFIALLLLASQSRRQGAKHRTFVYIDEAWEYLSDNKVAVILDQARKTRIGLILANQRTSQITNPNMKQAMMTTAIKFVSTDDDQDTHMLARPMKVEPEFIASLGKLRFAAYVRGMYRAEPVYVPLAVLENMEKAPLEPLRKRMRELYGPDPVKPKASAPEPEDEDIKPSSEL
jgi:hypothetical protein